MAYTLKQITGVIEGMVEHPQLRVVIDAGIVDDDGIKSAASPLLAYDVTSGNVSGRLSYVFVLQCMTSIRADRSDLREAQGDTAQILNDVIVTLEDSDVFQQEELDFEITPIEDSANSRIGWSVELELFSERQSCKE